VGFLFSNLDFFKLVDYNRSIQLGVYMDLTFLLLCIPAIVIPLIAKYVFKTTITGKELALNIAIALLVVGGTIYAGRYSQTADVEIINGEVTGKRRDTVSCSHSYSCNCRTVTSGSGSNRTSSTSCDTCYEHRNDYDWLVLSNVGKFEIDRIDKQGSRTPPRWERVEKGQPVALENTYTNYIKGAAHSLFHSIEGEHKFSLPPYPTVYDYQYANRVLVDGVKVPNINEFNGRLANALKVIGPSKQANVVVVITKNPSAMYAKALKNRWLGGKKNDVVVVIGAPDYPAIAWVDVFSWAKSDIVNVALRNEIYELKTVDPESVVAAVTRVVLKEYVRKPMEEFEYLKDEVEPPTWVVILAAVFATLGSGLLAWGFHRHDVFGDERRTRAFGSRNWQPNRGNRHFKPKRKSMFNFFGK
jgi:hypothetical protein